MGGGEGVAGLKGNDPELFGFSVNKKTKNLRGMTPPHLTYSDKKRLVAITSEVANLI